MATIRQGYLDDYSQNNTGVGIGTSSPNAKLEIIGGQRFIFKKKNLKKEKKIITIGIPTTGRYSTSKFYINIPRIIYTRLLKDNIPSIGLVRNEILFFICISKIFKRFKNRFRFFQRHKISFIYLGCRCFFICKRHLHTNMHIF